jgi:hypothetical protein
VSRSSRRAEAARREAAEKDFVRTAADRVGPLAQSAAGRVGPLAVSAADAIGAAADKVSPLAHSAADRVGPLAQSAADRVGPLAQGAADRIAPLASQAVGRVGPYAKLAVDRVTPYTQSAAERIVPLAATARVRGAQVTEDARRLLSPVIDPAVVRFGPVVTSARDRVSTDLLPRLTDAFGVGAAPVVEEVVLPEPKKKGRWVKRLAILGALGAVIAVVARRFLGNRDADWQAARPSTPYVPPTRTGADSAPSAAAGSSTAAATTDATDDDSASAETTEATVSDLSGDGRSGAAVEEDFAATEPAPIGLLNVTDSGDVEEIVVDEVRISEPVPDLPETEPVNAPVAGDEPAPAQRAARFSGEGVYVGHEPPEGYVIKGNERSMKYHMPEASGYSRTVAEVWFNSEEAAQQAGFVRAQR